MEGSGYSNSLNLHGNVSMSLLPSCNSMSTDNYFCAEIRRHWLIEICTWKKTLDPSGDGTRISISNAVFILCVTAY